ncbi:hypothetical protein Tco_0821536 [Tanacetum coccineum]|uniref:Uncharacterized protein n=1 Tax=Tanacetum coccineum TaxID=301880 RepID=A0ABQ5AFI7_9ASTR
MQTHMGSYLPIIWRDASKQARKKEDQRIKKEPFTLAGARQMRRNPSAARAYLSLFTWVIIIIIYDFVQDEVEDYNEDDENNPIDDDPLGGGVCAKHGGSVIKPLSLSELSSNPLPRFVPAPTRAKHTLYTTLNRDTTGLSYENTQLLLQLQAMKQQTQLRDCKSPRNTIPATILRPLANYSPVPSKVEGLIC